ncbi:MAG: N-acetylneuraminate synthase [Bacteroidota bacterium]
MTGKRMVKPQAEPPWGKNGVYLVAEAGINHNGNPARALAMIDCAAGAGADAVKFQVYHAEDLVQPGAAKAEYQKERTGADETQLEMLRQYEFPPDIWAILAKKAADAGLDLICTPFDDRSLELLEGLPVKAVKVASGEITNHPLLKRIAKTRKPVILSTGMSTLGEIDAAVSIFTEAGAADLALLHCTSAYPASDAEVNLRAMRTLAEAFQKPVGYSDHTPGVAVAVAAVALGAVIIEKHFTLDKSLPGPDHTMSLGPDELRSFVEAIRRVEIALGSPVKQVTPGELELRTLARRSICAAVEIAAGTMITDAVLTYKRPGYGIPPSFTTFVLGKTARRTIKAGECLTWSDF